MASPDIVKLTALEFFSGIGLARAGMERAGVSTVWANDLSADKCAIYRKQWGSEGLSEQNIQDVKGETIPAADIAWASSPCTDLSLAGKREGIVKGRESSAFFGFSKALREMGDDRRPTAAVLENVIGLASSNNGDDLRAVIEEFNTLGYACDALALDARRWLPQSRPRMFVIAMRGIIPHDAPLSSSLRPDSLSWIHADESLRTFVAPLPDVPELKTSGFTAIVEDMSDEDPRWWDEERVAKFMSSLTPIQEERIKDLRELPGLNARTAYRRTRNGVPRWEVRPDDIAGCLRTARGGSSIQAVVVSRNGQIRVRHMTGLEYARLQGAGDFDLTGFRGSQIRYAFGDAVAVPAVELLMSSVVVPLVVIVRSGEGMYE